MKQHSTEIVTTILNLKFRILNEMVLTRWRAKLVTFAENLF
ncbi:MAG: hypothetical protein BWX63_00962 [Bacteroidetes bacterium ADurb.Bin041]|jgi:hypothetical protein|nr:MAG: hypothetical protein BWX63_00962 [Bacteroidetes bacterium ADurb.Bin041]